MKIKKLIFVGVLGVVVAATATRCTYYNGEDLYPNVDCDTANISFSTDVYPIIKTQCNNCHAEALQLGGVNLENYEAIKEYATATSISRVINKPTGNVDLMPPAGRMPDCTINKISAWVRQGAKDN